MLFEYLMEHYPFCNPIEGEKIYRNHLQKEGFRVIEKPCGFIIYKFQGDACIINDIFTTLEVRKSGKAWDLFKAVKMDINQHPDCKVIIGFTEYGTKDRQHGIGAMLAAGFIPSYKLTDRQVFIRGVE